jgi:hypothetical protein
MQTDRNPDDDLYEYPELHNALQELSPSWPVHRPRPVRSDTLPLYHESLAIDIDGDSLPTSNSNSSSNDMNRRTEEENDGDIDSDSNSTLHTSPFLFSSLSVHAHHSQHDLFSVLPRSRQNTPPPFGLPLPLDHPPLLRSRPNTPLERFASSMLAANPLEKEFSRDPTFLQIDTTSTSADAYADDHDHRESGSSSHLYAAYLPPSWTLFGDLNRLFENPAGRLTNAQRAFILLYSMYEVYRTVISSFLVVFVPQKCALSATLSPPPPPNDTHACTLLQNLVPQDTLEVVAITFNSVLAFYFCLLFWLERTREKEIQKHLVIDRAQPTDKECLVAMLRSMDPLARSHITKMNNLYRFCAQGMITLVCVNMCISCAVVSKNYLNNNTAIVFITNALFMVNRIYKALVITSSGEYNIYSAYRTDNLLYNRDRSSEFHLRTGVACAATTAKAGADTGADAGANAPGTENAGMHMV